MLLTSCTDLKSFSLSGDSRCLLDVLSATLPAGDRESLFSDLTLLATISDTDIFLTGCFGSLLFSMTSLSSSKSCLLFFSTLFFAGSVGSCVLLSIFGFFAGNNSSSSSLLSHLDFVTCGGTIAFAVFLPSSTDST